MSLKEKEKGSPKEKRRVLPLKKEKVSLKEKRKFLENKIKNQSLQAESEREIDGFACRLL